MKTSTKIFTILAFANIIVIVITFVSKMVLMDRAVLELSKECMFQKNGYVVRSVETDEIICLKEIHRL